MLVAQLCVLGAHLTLAFVLLSNAVGVREKFDSIGYGL